MVPRGWGSGVARNFGHLGPTRGSGRGGFWRGRRRRRRPRRGRTGGGGAISSLAGRPDSLLLDPLRLLSQLELLPAGSFFPSLTNLLLARRLGVRRVHTAKIAGRSAGMSGVVCSENYRFRVLKKSSDYARPPFRPGNPSPIVRVLSDSTLGFSTLQPYFRIRHSPFPSFGIWHSKFGIHSAPSERN
jgi:hypothetical protein